MVISQLSGFLLYNSALPDILIQFRLKTEIIDGVDQPAGFTVSNDLKNKCLWVDLLDQVIIIWQEGNRQSVFFFIAIGVTYVNDDQIGFATINRQIQQLLHFQELDHTCLAGK